jgi:hypothetical protein
MPGATPIYAFPYPDPSDLVANYPALGQDLAEDIETVIDGLGEGGLSPSTPSTLANTGGTATLTDNTVTFSGVTSVSLNGCFSAAFDNYSAVITLVGSADVSLRFRVSGADNTSTSYHWISRSLQLNGTNDGTLGNRGAAVNAITYTSFSGAGCLNREVLDITAPFTTAYTSAGTNNSLYTYGGNTGLYMGSDHYLFAGTTSFDGFTLYCGSSFDGTISVYGYAK